MTGKRGGVSVVGNVPPPPPPVPQGRARVLRCMRSSHPPRAFDQGQAIFGLLDKKWTSAQRTHRPDDAHPTDPGVLFELQRQKKGSLLAKMPG